MTYTLRVNKCHTCQNLFHVVFYFSDWDCFVLFFSLLNYLLEILIAVLKNDVLNALPVLLLAVVNIDHLYAVFAISKLLQDFKLS